MTDSEDCLHADVNQRLILEQKELVERFRQLVEIGIALSAERYLPRLLEQILVRAKEMAHADGGTLYLRTSNDMLEFAIMRNDTLGIAMGGTTGRTIPYPPIALRDEKTGAQNLHNVATYVALTRETVSVSDVYSERDRFDFTGTKSYDNRTGYTSKSFLAVPLANHRGEVVGVLQLLNALNRETDEVIPFPPSIQPSIESLASQAAIAIDNNRLLEQQKNLLESFIRLIAKAIDLKSPYTSRHCERVPILTEMFAEAACKARSGPLADFFLDDAGMYELRIAAWMHDCGKVTTPEFVMDKATKLETIVDRIELVKNRFEVARRDAEIDTLQKIAAGGDPVFLWQELSRRLADLDDDLAFLEKANVGGEFMKNQDIERVQSIARHTWRNRHGEELPLLTDDEVKNLSIRKGTLNSKERETIQHHITATIEMLEQLPFPDHLKRVPEFAGGHHEKMDGTGYPRGLKREQMSIPARMMAIADIFEALTAADRPYKKPKTLSESIRILWFMKKDHHIDPDLFELFLRSGVYMEYAKRFLRPEQIDQVDVSQYLAPTS